MTMYNVAQATVEKKVSNVHNHRVTIIWFHPKITHAKLTHYMNTRVFIQCRVSIGSNYATPIKDDIT